MQYSDLLDRSFPVPAGRHYFDDFPVWDPQFAVESVFRPTVFEGNQLVAGAGVRVVDLKIPNKSTVKVALIGAVVTEPASRGRGLASTIVTQALSWAESQGACLALLWGSEHRLYQRLGFEFFGQQTQFSLDRISAPRSSAIQVHRGWNSRLFQLLQNRSTGLVLKESDRPWYEAHRNVEWFYTGNPNQPTAYAALGRGIDLPGLVHEWGGNTECLVEILKEIHTKNPKALLLGPPESPHWIQADLRPIATDPLCMAKSLNGTNRLDLAVNTGLIWVWGLDAA